MMMMMMMVLLMRCGRRIVSLLVITYTIDSVDSVAYLSPGCIPPVSSCPVVVPCCYCSSSSGVCRSAGLHSARGSGAARRHAGGDGSARVRTGHGPTEEKGRDEDGQKNKEKRKQAINESINQSMNE